jgi:ankyrin repeat protein
MWAARNGHREVCELLINNGADVSAVDKVRKDDDGDDDDDDDDECD